MASPLSLDVGYPPFEVQGLPVNDCPAASCDSGALARGSECTSFYSAILVNLSRSRIFVVGSPGCPSGLSSPLVTIQLSLGALLVCLRPSLAASTFLTCPDIGALCPEWAPLNQISMSLLGFIITGIVVFTVIALAPSHFVNMHIISPKEIRCLVPIGKS